MRRLRPPRLVCGTAFRRLPSRVPFRQAWPRSGGKARARAFQGPRFPVLRLLYQSLVKALAYKSRIVATLLHYGAGGRRYQICGVCLRPFGYISSRRRRSTWRCAAGGREGTRVRAKGKVWLRRRRNCRAARAHPDSPGPDAELLLLQRCGVRRGPLRAAPGGRSALGVRRVLDWIRKLQARFYAGDYLSALAAAAKAAPLLQTRPYRSIPSAIETSRGRPWSNRWRPACWSIRLMDFLRR